MESKRLDNAETGTKKTKRKIEFGDFQTPVELTTKVCSLLSRRRIKPASILEPTCGEGNFLLAAYACFPSANKILGLEINKEHIKKASYGFKEAKAFDSVKILNKDFFVADWDSILATLPDPLLVIGNFPWVTNAELGILGSSNLPEKSNFQNHKGFDAITGKSNFDISEWMLIKALEWINGRRAVLAMLCKTAVARKVLFYGWKNNHHLKRSDIYLIDAPKYFGAAVDACLLVVKVDSSGRNYNCQVHDKLKEGPTISVYGYREGDLVSDVNLFNKWRHLKGKEWYKWRSGIKHDCSKVMELRVESGLCRNGFGDLVNLEDEYLYPMLKSSDLVNSSMFRHSRFMIVTQKFVGGDTSSIKEKAPLTWKYLSTYAERLDKRRSSIYKNRPRFSIFGIGDYSFSKWKIAISGFYKNLEFRVISPINGKPVVLDDTCYFLTCKTKKEALFISQLLNSEIAKEFYCSFIFWDAKRPVTMELLQKLDLLALAKELDLEDVMRKYLGSEESKL